MIQPAEIRRKAENLFPTFLRAWLSGEEFFPRTIPCDKAVDENLSIAIASVQALQAGAKESLGFGYSIEWEERSSRTHGRNRFPLRIYFESADDFLRLIGKQKQFVIFSTAVAQVRGRHPALDRWIGSNRQSLIEAGSEVGGLLEVVDYLCAHPRPGLFARELPLSVDTKFIERNQGILREWLDIVLPPDAIRADEEHFARRFGLKYAEPHILIRFLDPALQQAAGMPWAECSIPLHALAKTPIQGANVLIVENKVNLLTLPLLSGTVALGGLGYGVTDLRYLGWLSDNRLYYWGDIDVDGFTILSHLRTAFPQVQSLLMDEETVARWRGQIGSTGHGRIAEMPVNLLRTEQSAFAICAAENLRVEQERFPNSFIQDYFPSVLTN